LNHHIHIPQPIPHTPLLPFQLKHTQPPKQLIPQTQYFTLPQTLAPLQTFISLPPFITHPSIPPHLPPKQAITDRLVPLSIGIQDTQ
uniref:PLP-dependent transferase n=1 Tax=Staphylococcus hominis TaxID=1290 RepID=UPI001643BC87